MKISGLVALLAFMIVGTAQASDYTLALEGTGKREYYCTKTVSLKNETAEPLIEISGFFYAFVDDEKVGRSKGAWFMNVPPGGKADAVFETPNAPCEAITRYDFVLGACRIGNTFEDKTSCAARISGSGPITVPSADG